MHRDIEVALGRRDVADDRLDGEPDRVRLVRAEADGEADADERPVDLHAIRRLVEGDPGRAEDRVAAASRERHDAAVDPGRFRFRSLLAEHPADLEDVGEVGSELETDLESRRNVAVVLDAHPLEEPTIDDARATDVERLLRDDEFAALVEIGVREVDLPEVASLRRRGEQHRRTAGERQVEPREEPRVARVEPEPVVVLEMQIALQVGVEERVVLLDGERAAREVRDEDGGRALDGARWSLRCAVGGS